VGVVPTFGAENVLVIFPFNGVTIFAVNVPVSGADWEPVHPVERIV
jgi:hypothetical protein